MKRQPYGEVALAAIVVVLTISILYHPPYLIVAPGAAIDLTNDITVEGVPSGKPTGKYLLITVSLTRPSALRAAAALLNHDLELVPETRYLKPGVSTEEYLHLQKAVFKQSQMAAAAAAANANGMEVSLTGKGARITDIRVASPAEQELKVGDVITSVDGGRIGLVSDLTAITTTRSAGSGFELEVRRGGKVRTIVVRSAILDGFNEAGTGIGVMTITEDLLVDLPFEVKFKERNIAGPSAGLVYALTMADMLDDADIAGKRVIAASGSIQLDGVVGPVGGLEQKAIVARRAGAELLLVPHEEVQFLDDARVRGVGNLTGALSVLQAAS